MMYGPHTNDYHIEEHMSTHQTSPRSPVMDPWTSYACPDVLSQGPKSHVASMDVTSPAIGVEGTPFL